MIGLNWPSYCLLFFPLFSFLWQPSAPGKGDIIFHLRGLTPGRGYARVVLYNSPELFLSQFGFCAADSAIVNSKGEVDITIHNLSFGKYAGSFYQDENHNHIIDRNIAGLPTEPYAFSNNIRAKWIVPSFNSASFEFHKTGDEKYIYLKYWNMQ